MPGDLTQNFAWFFVVYVGAIALGILSHAPDGLGVFEATIVAGLAARGRVAKEGYDFAIIPRADLPAHPAELRRVSDARMAMKQGGENAFALGSFDEPYLANFDHVVLRHRDTGRIVDFANLFQGGGRHELSLDLMRHDPAGPKVAMDALFGEMMLWGAVQGFEWFCLGAVPFAGLDNHQLASLWNRIGGFVYAPGEQFYHFEGLRLQAEVRSRLDSELPGQPRGSGRTPHPVRGERADFRRAQGVGDMIAHYTDHSANERTLLAWVRTAIAIVGFGLGAARLGGAEAALWSEVAMLIAGAVVIVLAWLRMRHRRARIASPDPTDDDPTFTDAFLLLLPAALFALLATFAIHVG